MSQYNILQRLMQLLMIIHPFPKVTRLKMKTLHLFIVIIATTFVLVETNISLINADCNYCWVPTENKSTSMRISIQSMPTQLNLTPPQDRQIHLRFFDANTNHLIENVTFAMYVTKGNQTFLQNNFWTQSGSFTLNLKPGERYLWSANPDHDPMDGLYYSKGDQIDIDTSYLTSAMYDFSIQPLAYAVSYTGQQNVGMKFETTLNLLDSYNKTITPDTNIVSPTIPEFPLTIPILFVSFASLIVFYRM